MACREEALKGPAPVEGRDLPLKLAACLAFLHFRVEVVNTSRETAEVASWHHERCITKLRLWKLDVEEGWEEQSTVSA